MTGATAARNKVFISYSREDADWLECVRTHLHPLHRDCGIEIWDDTRIPAGEDWSRAIADAIATARVIVLLVSPHFLRSDFIAKEEIPLLEAARLDGATILPLIISYSRFAKTPGLSHLQTVNDPATPLINMTQGEQDKVFFKLTEAVELAFTQSAPALRDQTPPTQIQTSEPLRVPSRSEFDQTDIEILKQIYKAVYCYQRETESSAAATPATPNEKPEDA